MKQVVVANTDASKIIAAVLNAQKSRKRGPFHYMVTYLDGEVALWSHERGAMTALRKFLKGRYSFWERLVLS